MRLTQARIRQLCRLLLAAWCLVFAFGVVLGCQEQAPGGHEPVTLHVQPAAALTSATHAADHDSSPSPLCEQACQTLSSPLAKVDAGVALPLLSALLLVCFLLPPLLLQAAANIPHLLLPPAPAGTPPRPHLLYQRFNN